MQLCQFRFRDFGQLFKSDVPFNCQSTRGRSTNVWEIRFLVLGGHSYLDNQRDSSPQRTRLRMTRNLCRARFSSRFCSAIYICIGKLLVKLCVHCKKGENQTDNPSDSEYQSDASICSCS